MDWPKSLDVVVEYEEEKQVEKSAALLRSVENYGLFGPMAQYVTADGEKFWIVVEYLIECQGKKQLPKIPIEVITKQASIDRKLEYAKQTMNHQRKQQETGLVLPDGIQV
jgi:hypothetical protein